MLEDRFERMTREELLQEIRGLIYRYEQFRNSTLPTLNKISEERDQLRRTVARLEGKLDQIAADFEAIAEFDDTDYLDKGQVVDMLKNRAVQAYQRALGQDYYTDEEL